MKRLQRSSAKRVLVCKTNGQVASNISKRQKITSPWLVIPPLNEDEAEDTMKEKTQQLRKICRLPRTDQAMAKTLKLATYPVRRRMIIDATESVESLLKLFPPLLQPIHVSDNIFHMWYIVVLTSNKWSSWCIVASNDSQLIFLLFKIKVTTWKVLEK